MLVEIAFDGKAEIRADVDELFVKGRVSSHLLMSLAEAGASDVLKDLSAQIEGAHGDVRRAYAKLGDIRKLYAALDGIKYMLERIESMSDDRAEQFKEIAEFAESVLSSVLRNYEDSQ